MASWKVGASPRDGSLALDLNVISPWEIGLSLSEYPGKYQGKVFIATRGRAKQYIPDPLALLSGCPSPKVFIENILCAWEMNLRWTLGLG